MTQNPVRLALACILGSSLFLSTVVSAAAPNFDRRAEAAASSAALTAARGRFESLSSLGRVGQIDETFAVPTILWAPAQAGAVAGAPVEIAQRQLGRIAPFYGLDRTDLAGVALTRLHDTGRGGIIASYVRAIDGTEVFGEQLNVLLGRDNRFVAASGFLTPRGGAPIAAFRWSAAQAAARGLEDFGGTPGLVRAAGAAPGGYEAFARVTGAELTDPIRVKRVLFHLPDHFEPAYTVELMGVREAVAYVISAVDGSLLRRINQTEDVNFAYRVWAEAPLPHTPYDGPQGTASTPHPTGLPDFFNPGFVPPVLISLSNGPIPTADPWLDGAATETNGNNVDAYADLATPDGFSAGDLRATTTSPNTFDRPYDPNQAPGVSNDQRMASITQLFYTTNYLHDFWYTGGFDEASGNAQTDNYGRGGVAGDNLRAEAQDFSGTFNANMSTPSDGGRPRMQMFLFPHGPAYNLNVNAPGSIAGQKTVAGAVFGPQSYNVTGNVVLASDAVAPANDGCSAPTNSVAGLIAIVDRGTCSFISKVQTLEAAGAIGVIIVNNVAGTPSGMSGVGVVNIPSLHVSQAEGNAIKAELLSGNVNVTMLAGLQVNRDGSLDDLIVAHEYGHYVSGRLIGNGLGITTVQSRGMGEGWGDAQALLLAMRNGDNYAGVYGLFGYSTNTSVAPSNSYYFGGRRYPYSTDLAKNPLTFKHISDANALPVGPPLNANGLQNSEVHNTGEVWCSMLWECYAALLLDSGRLTFAQAQQRMRDYLVAARKMTPVDPTFTEARDALLAVAYAADPVDGAAFCAGFAKRGCGTGAVAPDRFSTNNAGVVESFACGGEIEFVSSAITDDVRSCDNDGMVDNGESGTLRVTLRNTGATTLSATTITVTSPNPAVNFPFGHTVNVPASTPFTDVTAPIIIGVNNGVGIEPISFTINVADAGLLNAFAPVAPVYVPGNADAAPSNVEDVELSSVTWIVGGNPLIPANAWSRAFAGSSYVFHGPDQSGISDQTLATPPLQVAPAGNFTFTFSHRHSFESSDQFYDGGVIEITNDGGANWTDIGASASPGYNGTITNTSGNPLGLRPAFVATNPAWPAFNLVTVNLGSTYAGQTVQVRFRLGTDAATAAAGWDLDNLTFNNLVNQPFQQAIPEPGVCAPVAVGDDLPVEFALSVLGANPMHGTSALRFALPQPSRVTIALYDIAGRRIAPLVDGEFAAGVHATRPIGSSIRSGVYFARMDAGAKRLVQRIVVLP